MDREDEGLPLCPQAMASDDEVRESLHFWIIDEGLLESFLVGWCYVGMVDSDIKWKVGAWPGTVSRECV